MDIFIRKSLVLFFSLFFPLTLCALEVSLDQVTGINKRGGEFQFSLENRAKFDFDPDENTLSSSGTWVAENRTGPNLLIRYSHKVENFSVNAKGIYSVKSYECVEGTFGAMLGMNYCGNYRFGPNTLDDGGFADDDSTGRPISLHHFVVSLFKWDGSTLTVILNPINQDQADAYPELGLTLIFLSPEMKTE